ncbi:DUF2939 domain-containing protein [Microvirga sp. STR05]|uniref:DUF2939 domain-containing protein n=1 Tax=Hymenobacter duratus TaxID=2771356 RepID=A0ABR8JAR9_9BACT|nr:DUF2939 domain-containing protein [Hymenobacter duratus]MBD2713498.1 DUF2939 domain-containing protein [Hymenobacter duratus]MBR7948400.1 DUF2939 domain-containing protein [Microvirga sp. STR05]
MKRLLILLVLVAMVAGGYFYYQSLKSGPKYSLMQAANAVRTHDVADFERYVDVSSVTGSLVDQVTNQGSALGLLNPGGMVFKGALRLMKPQLAQAARKELQHYIETGSVEAATAARPDKLVNVSMLGLAGKVVNPDSQFKDIKYVNEQGEQALVGLEFTQPKYDTTLVVELKMLNRGDHWQVTEITNSGELLKHVARLEKKKIFGGK